MSTAIAFDELPRPAATLDIAAGGCGHQSPFHCLIAVEGERCTETAIKAALTKTGSGCVRVTVVVVADPMHMLVVFVPISGVACAATHLQICPEEQQRESVVRAAAIARDAIEFVPEQVPAQHRVAANWHEALRMADQCDLLVIAAPPSRLRDRRLLRRRGITALVTDLSPIVPALTR